MMEKQEWIEIGLIVAAQGLQGEIRVKPSSDFPERFVTPGKRWLQKGEQLPQPVQLMAGYQIPGREIYVVQLEHISDRTQAETLRGCKLLVPISDRPTLSCEEYHVADLIGLKVYHQGEIIGEVINIYSPAQDLLEITTDRLNKKGQPVTVLIPFVKQIVTVVDLVNGFIQINPPSGLLEI